MFVATLHQFASSTAAEANVGISRHSHTMPMLLFLELLHHSTFFIQDMNLPDDKHHKWGELGMRGGWVWSVGCAPRCSCCT
jgi:hypothetical protein